MVRGLGCLDQVPPHFDAQCNVNFLSHNGADPDRESRSSEPIFVLLRALRSARNSNR